MTLSLKSEFWVQIVCSIYIYPNQLNYIQTIVFFVGLNVLVAFHFTPQGKVWSNQSTCFCLQFQVKVLFSLSNKRVFFIVPSALSQLHDEIEILSRLKNVAKQILLGEIIFWRKMKRVRLAIKRER